MPISRISAMSEHRARKICWLILTTICIALWTAGCGRKPAVEKPTRAAGQPARPAEPEPERTKVDARFEGARVTWDDDQGKRIWEAGFKSATASAADGSAEVELIRVEASLYRDGKVASRMVAPRVVADSSKKEIRAYGGVKVTSLTDNTTATADEMIWKPKENKIFGTGGVRMDRGNIHIRARSITADTALKRAKLSDADAIL